MRTCTVCFSEIQDNAIKCRYCQGFIKPKTNEGQFWGTCLMVGGIFIGVMSYIKYLYDIDIHTFEMLMKVALVLAYFGFLVFGLGTFISWFIFKPGGSKAEEKLEAGKKICLYCGEIIDKRASKCRYCLSFLRQEKGKILATFITVSGILIITTAYVLLLAGNLQSGLYTRVGAIIILVGILIFLFTIMRDRYSSRRARETNDMSAEV